MLHAFDGGRFRWSDNEKTNDVEHRGHFVWSGDTPDTAQYGSGRELWAYIPGNLMGKMKNNYAGAGADEAWLDASPALGDVYTDGGWRTVLIFCQGNGGHMVTCLDVTEPASPTLLWEIGDPALINSRSSPVIGMLDTGQWGAFLLSGATDAGDDPVVFMIDIETGEKTLIPLDAAGVEGQGGVGTGQPAVVDSDGDGYLDRMYVGTDKGFMYRVAMEGGSFTDAVINGGERSAAEGIHGAPAAVAHADGVRVFFGTGGDDAAVTYHFYGYFDTQRGEAGSPALEWSYALPAGHRVYASAFAAAGQVYFSTTTTVTEDPCEAGGASQGKIYAFKQILESPDAVPGPVSAVDLPEGSGRVAPIVDDQHLYIKTAFGTLQSFGGGIYNNDAAGVKNAEIALPVPEATVYSWKEVR
jgi:Tfp pilus tip-associated adhesin PilY1